MTTSSRARERSIAVAAVARASHLAQQVASHLDEVKAIFKSDKSPVTVADLAVQALVARELREAFGDVPLVAEEDSGAIKTNDNLRARVLEYVRAHAPSVGEGELVELLDRGDHQGGTGSFWTLDPIDGTKGFLRAEQYAIALALVEDREIRLGVLGCPNLPLVHGKADSPNGVVAVAVAGEGAALRSVTDATERAIRVSAVDTTEKAAFCESVEAGHTSHDDAANISAKLGVAAPPVRMDSQAKYVAVARGDAEIYLRLPTKADYEEKIWDHAAGVLLVREAGGQVSDVLGKPLDFARGKTLRGNYGVIATNGKLHARVVEATRPVFQHLPPR